MSHVVYKHFDAAGTPLYVGVSSNVEARQNSHKGREWWPFSATMQVVECGTEQIAKDYERREIYRLRPRFNRQYNPDHGNWTRPKRPVADRPSEQDRMLHVMQSQPVWTWPAPWRADYCRLLHLNAADPKAPKMNSPQVFYNWRRNGFPGFDQPETDE
jgi:hypothetical protein